MDIELLTGKSEKACNARMKTVLGFFFSIALVLVPISTLALASHASILHSSLSAIGNSYGKRISLIVWTIFVSVFFVCFFSYILDLMQKPKSLAKVFTVAAAIVMIAGNICPFLPEQLPKLAMVHDIMVKAAAAIFAVGVVFLTFDLLKYSKTAFCLCNFALIVVSVSCVWIMDVFGPNSLLQIIAVFSLSIMLVALLFWIAKSNKFDLEKVFESYDIEKFRKKEKAFMQKSIKLQKSVARLGACKSPSARQKMKIQLIVQKVEVCKLEAQEYSLLVQRILQKQQVSSKSFCAEKVG